MQLLPAIRSVAIAAQGSAVVQPSVRDQWIGWDWKKSLERLLLLSPRRLTKWTFQQIDDFLEGIVGLYGTVAYSVARRTSEIGIRIALEVQRSSVVFRVLREVFVLAVAGLAISVPAALGGSRFVESFLFGMKPNDPLMVVLAVATLLAAALAAGYIPARRASRIDPMIALRHE